MIENGDFALRDSRTNMDIDLKQPWELCFTPGQMVFMSMVFEGDFEVVHNDSPSCTLIDTMKGNGKKDDMGGDEERSGDHTGSLKNVDFQW